MSEIALEKRLVHVRCALSDVTLNSALIMTMILQFL